MRYYRCKCGKSTSWSSMGTYPCAICSACKSDLAEAPSLHQEPKPHRLTVEKIEVMTDEGKKVAGSLSRCYWCGDTKAEIEKNGEAFEYAAI